MKKIIFKRNNLLLFSLACLIIIAVGYASFDSKKNQAFALSANYNKNAAGQLSSGEWNNLDDDFVAKSGDTMSGNLVLNGSLCFGAVCQASWPSAAVALWAGTNNGDINSSNTGNVGIGTANPRVKLDVNGSIQLPDDNNTGRLSIGNFGSYLSRQGSDGSTVLQTGQAHLLLNPGTGNVGIGTLNPTQRLDVNGSIKGVNFLLVPQAADPASLQDGMMWLRQ